MSAICFMSLKCLSLWSPLAYRDSSSKYMLTPSVLTPSPNPDTDVLLPPPNFTISQQHNQRPLQHPQPPLQQSQHHLTATLTRQHARQNSTPSDMEQDTPPGLSPATEHLTSSPLPHQQGVGLGSGMRLYPGQARPVKQRSAEVGLGPQSTVGGKGSGLGVMTSSGGGAGSQQQLWRDLNCTSTPLNAAALSSSAALTPTHIGVDRLLESTKKELSAIAAQSSSLDYNKMSLSSGKSKKGTTRTTLLQSSSEPTPLLIKSHSISPKKGSPIPDNNTSKKIFASHNRSKSSVSLKPERAYDLNQNARDDLFVRFRDTYTRSLSTGSNIYDLLSRTRQISPSHTEICLTHVPSRHHEKPIVARGRNGDRLFTSRSLERPCTPRMDRSLSPPRKVASLPISRGRSRERSPSPYHAEPRRSIDLQLLGSNRGSIINYDMGSKRSSLANYDEMDLELRNIPRALTHEEEINMIIAGESATYLRMATPDSFPTTDAQSSESVVSNESEYEMRF